MIRKMELRSPITYASPARAEQAVKKKLEGLDTGSLTIDYFIYKTEEGRYFPVFLGERAMQFGIHLNFNVIG